MGKKASWSGLRNSQIKYHSKTIMIFLTIEEAIYQTHVTDVYCSSKKKKIYSCLAHDLLKKAIQRTVNTQTQTDKR